MFKYIFAFITALVSSLIITPLIIALANRIGALDVPEDHRRMHSSPVPRIGGLSLFFSFLIAVSIFSDLSSEKIFGLIFGSLIIVITGLLDDLKGLGPKVKLLMQILAATVLFHYGFRIEFFTNLLEGSDIIEIGTLSYPLTVFWIVGITNTINLMDGLDGLAAGITTIAAVTLSYVAFSFGRYETLLLSLILVGANLGFLPYNFNPAKIFMGDTGALFLGFVLSAIAIEGAVKSATAIAVILPLMALGLPIFDTAFAIFRRIITRRPLMEGDKGHLHHRLVLMGMDQKRAVLVLYLIATLLGVSVVLLINNLVLNTVITMAIVVFLIYIPIFITFRRSEDE